MAVSGVNNCRYCSYFHTQVSLRAGLIKEEIKKALVGDFNGAPKERLAVLYFAQHYADSVGNHHLDTVQFSKDASGEKISGDFGIYLCHYSKKCVGKYF